MAESQARWADSHLGKQERGNSYQASSNLGVAGQKEKDARVEAVCHVGSSARVTDY